ncbi:GbsR/MarR family transcriptional regulator [Pelagibius marinus]|uniref:GbsR/MarR family transcriptional regulator n=1 Tax=Pelagibius marinus TaxID=2762760 RepID=UPI002AC3367F|nr:MarR family transcriptional regulator [Pelagibius marinus]
MPPALREFILHWGDLGGQWGVNRSVAQIQALLYLSDRPLHAEEIATCLGIARSNVSNSLKWLVGWRLIERVPVPGDRRDHFVAETDIWEMVLRIAESRKEREIDPATAVLRRCVRAGGEDPRVGKVARQRLEAMLDFMETTDRWYQQMVCLPKAKVFALLKMGSRVVNFLSAVKKSPGKRRSDAPDSAPTPSGRT